MSQARLGEYLERFREGGEGRSLLDAALLVALADRDGCDPARVESVIAELAESARRYVEPHPHPRAQVEGLCAYLKDVRGLGGDAEQYYQRDNSYIDQVLESGRGIPITLAVIYVEVGRRLGLECSGVNFPGHFLVRFSTDPADAAAAPLLVDPFAGCVVSRVECQQFLQRVQGPDASLQARHLEPAAPLVVLVRMFNNLKQLALGEERLEDALRYSELILLAEPSLALEHGERASLFERLGQFDLAVVELQLLEKAVADDDLRAKIAARVTSLQSRAGPSRLLH